MTEQDMRFAFRLDENSVGQEKITLVTWDCSRHGKIWPTCVVTAKRMGRNYLAFCKMAELAVRISS